MNTIVKVAIIASILSSGAAFAADEGAGTVQRDVNQQTRIEQGLQSGQLTTREAAHLERQEAHVEHLQAKDLKDGSISPAEQARLNAAQNRVSRDIYRDKHNGRVGNPDSASSQRMQADVQRNLNQQSRIEQGIQSGSLSAGETAKLERGQAHLDRQEARAGADGHVGAGEQARIQRSENRQSRRIFGKKHN